MVDAGVCVDVVVDGVGAALSVPLVRGGGGRGGLDRGHRLPHSHVGAIPKGLDGVTEAGVLREELCELVTLVLVVAAAAAVAVGRDADFGGAQVVGSHHGADQTRVRQQTVGVVLLQTAGQRARLRLAVDKEVSQS